MYTGSIEYWISTCNICKSNIIIVSARFVLNGLLRLAQTGVLKGFVKTAFTL